MGHRLHARATGDLAAGHCYLQMVFVIAAIWYLLFVSWYLLLAQVSGKRRRGQLVPDLRALNTRGEFFLGRFYNDCQNLINYITYNGDTENSQENGGKHFNFVPIHIICI